MRQQGLFATGTLKTQFFHNKSLFGLGNYSSVKVGSLAKGVTLEFLKAALVIKPLVSH